MRTVLQSAGGLICLPSQHLCRTLPAAPDLIPTALAGPRRPQHDC